MSRIRRTIAAQMTKSASTIPHVTNFDDADVTELERLRKTIPPAYLGPTVKLTAMPFVLKAVALALRQHPLLNASLDEEKEEIVYKQYVNLGVAVERRAGWSCRSFATPIGWAFSKCPGIDAAGRTGPRGRVRRRQSSRRHVHHQQPRRRRRIYSTPIINHPEVAILLLGRSRWLRESTRARSKAA